MKTLIIAALLLVAIGARAQRYKDSVAKYREITMFYRQWKGFSDKRTVYYQQILSKYAKMMPKVAPDSTVWINRRKALETKFKMKLL